MNKEKVAIITGASSGIGEATALQFVAKGFRVFGTSRKVSVAKTPERPFTMLELNFAKEDSIANLVSEALRQTGRIDVLVNNAGYGITGAIEESSPDQCREIFEVNVIGPIRMAQAVLPTMREQHSGRIINISSVVGFLPGPFIGLYAASKHALEGLSESLDHEIRSFGVRSILVEPGFTKTKFGLNMLESDSPREIYERDRKRMQKFMKSSIAHGPSPETVASVVVAAACDRNPKLRYPVGAQASMVHLLRRITPATIADRVLRKRFMLDR